MLRQSLFDKLPEELLPEIFTRLPVKTIVHLSCVRKSWNALIKTPHFIKAHINRSLAHKNNTQFMLLRYHPYPHNQERFSIRFDNETFDEHMTLDNSYKFCPKRHYRIVGSCNGLICMCDYYPRYTGVLILWNPAIRKSFNLPMPPPQVSQIPLFVIGFGVDSCTNDFKVVRIVYYWNSDNVYLDLPKVEVYELSTGMWRGTSGIVPSDVMISSTSHVFLRGASHWVAYEEQSRILIVSFDMGSEVFREIMPPANAAYGSELRTAVSLFGETLGLIHYDDPVLGLTKSCCVWVMKEYGVEESWTKLYTIDVRCYIYAVLGVRRTGEVVVRKSNNQLVLYHPESKQEVYIEQLVSEDSVYFDTYVESLVLLDGKDQFALNQAYLWNKHLKEERLPCLKRDKKKKQ